MEYDLDTFLNWALGASKEERGFFVRRYLDNLPDEELNMMMGLICTAKKRRQRFKESVRQGRILQQVAAPVQGEPVPAQAKPVPAKEFAPNAELRVGSWRKFKPKDFIAVDVEKVEVPNPHQCKPKNFQVAADVAVVDYKGELIYKSLIKRQPGTFRVNMWAKNGFTSDSLKNVTDLEIVRRNLQELFSGKLVVGLALGGDLESLGMGAYGFEIFDLQWNWSTTISVGRCGRYSVCELCRHYFGVDMQPDGTYHSCKDDAMYTMKLFCDIYIKIRPEPQCKMSAEPCQEIV